MKHKMQEQNKITVGFIKRSNECFLLFAIKKADFLNKKRLYIIIRTLI